MIKKQKMLLSILGLSVALSMSTAIVVPEPVQAISFKKSSSNFKKNFRKNTRKFRRAMKTPKTRRLIQGIGGALIIGGIVKNSPAAAIIGIALVAAPDIFRRDIARSYRSDLDWSGCTRCTNRRAQVITVPGRRVSAETKNASVARVKEDIKDVQRALKALGLYKKRIDGDFGPGTRAGVKEFQRSLGVRETGILSAEQRYRLFIRSEQQGYQRQAVLNVVDEGARTVPSQSLPIVPAVFTPPEDMIEEYVLAKSQFKNFNEQYLQSGNQGMVSSANLLADGRIELTVKDAAGQTTKTVTGIINDIAVNPHKLSDQWVRIIYQDGTMSEPLTLNTRDDFPSTEAATTWMTQAKSKISILAKLTEVTPKDPEVRIAGTPPTSQVEAEQAEPTVPVNVAEAPKDSSIDESKPKVLDLQPGQKTVGSDGKIVIANNDNKDSGIDESKPKVSDLQPGQKAVGNDGKIVIAKNDNKDSSIDESKPKVSDLQPGQKAVGSDGKIVIANNDNFAIVQETPSISPDTANVDLNSNGKVGNTLTGFDAQIINETCRQNIYVSFLFPDGENPISHYNITPPEGTIMIDNGDSTAYFTGSCIQGNYDFSYVYIKEAKQQKDWKHFKREGAFQIASNSEQCSINLNSPEKSASLQCF